MKKIVKAGLAFCPGLYRVLMFFALPLVTLIIMIGVACSETDLSNSFYYAMLTPILFFYIAEAWADGIIYGNFSGGKKAFYFNYFLSSTKGMDVLKAAVKGDCLRRGIMSVVVSLMDIPFIIGTFYQQKSVDIMVGDVKLDAFRQSALFCVLMVIMLAILVFTVLTLVIWISRFFSLIWFGLMFSSMGAMLVNFVSVLALENIFIMLFVLVVLMVGMNFLFYRSVIVKGERCSYDS